MNEFAHERNYDEYLRGLSDEALTRSYRRAYAMLVRTQLRMKRVADELNRRELTGYEK